jgi:sec-independent protein translocase protein TatA
MLLAGLVGPDGIIVVVILLVLVFGGSAIPKLARNLGSAKNEFEKGLKSAKSADTTTDTTTPPTSDGPPASTPTDSDSAS